VADRYVLEDRAPTIEEYRALRAAVGWNDLTTEGIERGLGAALYSCIARDGDRIIGCGRIVGDGGIYFYLQDVIVHPEHQRRGLGARIMDALLAYLEFEAPRGAFIGLMAAEGASAFYEGYGFTRRANDRPGMYRVW
jgi:ribosomal protein S18 acetylase RimI-like enzyme